MNIQGTIENAIKEILNRLQSKKMRIDEYFSHLLSYNNIRTVNNISRYDFHKICLIEKYPYSAQEIDHIFDMLDLKKDNYINLRKVKLFLKIRKSLAPLEKNEFNFFEDN